MAGLWGSWIVCAGGGRSTHSYFTQTDSARGSYLTNAVKSRELGSSSVRGSHSFSSTVLLLGAGRG